MNSFIAWIGGKKVLRNNIITRFPKEIDRYIEVFGGAGWVLFAKEKHANLEVYNDKNGDLVNLYRCVKHHCEELQKELKWLLISREQFFDYKEQINTRGLTDIQRAAKYFYLIKTSFGADIKSFGANKILLNKSTEYLEEISQRLKNVVVENKDFENLIKVYDRPNALFYLDPPYLGAEKYYNVEFSMEDHIKLKECLSKIKGKFILSYNDDDYIKALYSGYCIESVVRDNALSNNKEYRRYKELIIKNF